MNLDAALERLFHRNLHVIKLDLEPMQVLMGILDHPEKKLICLHVAGTNGKGSVCAMLASILRKQGYRTGLYTSPHLVRFNERIQIDGKEIGDGELKELIDEIESATARLPALGHRDATFFEFTTALAFLYFARKKCELVVLETGMGGRLDATNVVIPALSIITSIGLEHTAYLGDTLAKIAGEKAGIIKPGRPVVVGPVPEEAFTVIAGKARDAGAPLLAASELVHVAERSVSLEGQKLELASEQETYGTVMLPLPGRHQAANAAITVAALECLHRDVGIAVSNEAIKQGLAATVWPARGQLLSKDPPVILDGAHNPEAAQVLGAWIKRVARKKPVGLVLGFLADKDPAVFFQALGLPVQRLWIVPLESDRAMPVGEVARRLSFVPHTRVAAGVGEALAQSRLWAHEEKGLVVITGSFYLAGETLRMWETLPVNPRPASA